MNLNSSTPGAPELVLVRTDVHLTHTVLVLFECVPYSHNCCANYCLHYDVVHVMLFNRLRRLKFVFLNQHMTMTPVVAFESLNICLIHSAWFIQKYIGNSNTMHY